MGVVNLGGILENNNIHLYDVAKIVKIPQVIHGYPKALDWQPKQSAGFLFFIRSQTDRFLDYTLISIQLQ